MRRRPKVMLLIPPKIIGFDLPKGIQTGGLTTGGIRHDHIFIAPPAVIGKYRQSRQLILKESSMQPDHPHIRILQGIYGASQAVGLTVVIDVLRAFSTACYAMAQGARGIIPVAGVAEAFDLRRKHPDWIIMGERKGIKVTGFDLGNSPFEIRKFGSLKGSMIVQATSNGTRGVAAARNAESLLTGSFVNAKAIVDHIRLLRPARVDLVCMGTSSGPAVEDDLCAHYIAGLIKGTPPDLKDIFATISRHPSTRRFRTQDVENFPAKDLALCLRADIFNFVIRRKKEFEGRILLG